MIVGSYFESIASFIHGESSEGQSKRFFGVGFETVFPGVRDAAKEEDQNNAEQILSEFLATFYSELRCGLFHEAMVRGKIVIRQQEGAVVIIVVEKASAQARHDLYRSLALPRRGQEPFQDIRCNATRSPAC